MVPPHSACPGPLAVHCRTGVALLVAVTACACAAEPPVKPPDAPLVRFLLMDGGSVTGAVQPATAAVQTAYGRLEVPLADIISLTPGLDSHPELAEEFAKWVRDLGSPDFEARQRAQETLAKQGPKLREVLAEFRDDADAERRAQVQTLLKKWEDEVKAGREAGRPPMKRRDQVQTKLVTMSGSVKVKQYAVKTEYGELKVDLALVRALHALAPQMAPASEPVKAPSVSAELRDGSLVKGTTEFQKLGLTGPYGKLTFPLALIESVDLTQGLRQAKVQFRNGDLLQGVLEADAKMTVKTAHGVLNVAVADVARLDVVAGELEDGLALAWNFDEQTAKDTKGKVEGEVRGDVKWEEGILGKAPCFSSQATRLVWNSPRLSMNGWRQVTFSVWVKMKNYSTYGTVFARAAGKQSCGVGLNLGGVYGPRWTGGGFHVAFGEKEQETVHFVPFRPDVQPHPPVGKWYHIAATYDGRSLRGFVNGQLAGEKAVKEPGAALFDMDEAETVLGNHALEGIRDWSDQYFPGLIDELKIWKRALTPAEVRRLFDDTVRKTKVAEKPAPAEEF